MNYFEEKELLEKRASIVKEQEALIEAAEKEGRDLTSDEEKQFDKMEEEYTSYTQRINRIREFNKRQDSLNEGAEARADKLSYQSGNKKTADEVKEQEDKRKEVFWKIVRQGKGSLDDKERQIASEMRAQSTTNNAGGYTIPEGFSNQLEDALLAFGGMRMASTVMRTASGNDLPWPTSDDTSNKGEILGENTEVNTQDITFGVKTLGAYKYSSKLIKVSIELLQDSAFDLESYLGGKLAERIGRITNEHFTTGSGSSEPEGIIHGATLGVSAAADDAFTFGEVIDLVHSVDPAYRNKGSNQVGFMFSDATLKEIKKLSIGSSDARPLWQPSFVVGEPDRIDGYRYFINQDIDDANTGGNQFMLFGDFSKYIIRDVKDITLLVLRERFADFHQVGFLAFSRHDGLLIDAGTNPVKYMRNQTT